jgi:hypothetical protein
LKRKIIKKNHKDNPRDLFDVRIFLAKGGKILIKT